MRDMEKELMRDLIEELLGYIDDDDEAIEEINTVDNQKYRQLLRDKFPHYYIT